MPRDKADPLFFKSINHTIEQYILDDPLFRPTKVYVINGSFVISEETYLEYLGVLGRMQRDNADFVYSFGSENDLFEAMTFKKRIK